ncbi:hypothetical protein FGRMN_8172 [Fusarium graminum]|nr:hypothetical protein FGRMN_8172 [Fusarium graminum]
MMRPSPRTSPYTARHACEVCRERKVRCDRALPKCRSAIPRIRIPALSDDAIDSINNELQERLAKTEAQLALKTPISMTGPVNSQPQENGTSRATLSRCSGSLGSTTPDATSQRSLQYQLPTTEPRVQSIPASIAQSTASHPMDLEGPRNVGKMIDLPLSNSPTLDIDLFTAESGSNMEFDWPGHLHSLEPLDSLLLNRLSPRSLTASGTEEEISGSELSILHSYYFESIYFSFPFLNQDRFFAEPRDAFGISALIYAVALAGCAHSPGQQNKQSICYKLARNYAEGCEREDQMKDLNLFQALLFIGRFEALNGKLERSWMTLGRAVMLAKLMGLQQMDQTDADLANQDDSNLNPSDVTNQVLLEERRRSFWALYILLSYVKTRTGWQCMLGDVEDFLIRLPSPGLLRSDLVPVQMPFLSNVSKESSTDISSYAGCVLMVDLALSCFSHGQKQAKTGFWDGYCDLVKKTDELFGMLKRHLNAGAIRSDPVAFSLYLNLRATEIFSHESAISRSEKQGLPPLMTAESQRRATAAAFQISTAVRLNLPSPRKAQSDIIMLQGIFIAWPLTMALKAFDRELGNGEGRNNVNGVVASSRLLFTALGHIEEVGGHWHQSVAHVERKIQEWEERNGFESLALRC